MISETRTKITSWLKSPKSLAAKAGIGAVVALSVSVPAVSALVMNNEPEPTQNSSISAEKPQESPEVEQKASESADPTPENEQNNATTPADNGTNNANQPDSTPEQSVAEPPKPVYTDSYPFAARCLSGQPVQAHEIDQWGQTKCQSTSYVAWKVSEAGKTMPKYWGDASTWPAKADAANIPRGTTPKLHSVAVVGNFNAFVEAVDGDTITVSWYNWGNTGQYGVWENIPASKFSTYIYF